MTQKDFFANVAENILDYLPESYAGAEVELKERIKDGGIVLHGLSLKKADESEDCMVPILYLEDYYTETDDISDVLDKIAKTYVKWSMEIEGFHGPDTSREGILEDVRCRAIDAKANKNMLASLVHSDLGCGYAMVYYINISFGDTEGIMQITHDICKDSGIDEKELKERAFSNTQEAERATFTEVQKVLFGLIDVPQYLTEDLYIEPNASILVLRNDKEPSHYGATVLFYPETKEMIADILDCSYYVLPSSIHDVMIIPDNEIHRQSRATVEDMLQMVCVVNEYDVAVNERFGNKVLYYDRERKELSVIAEIEK